MTATAGYFPGAPVRMYLREMRSIDLLSRQEAELMICDAKSGNIGISAAGCVRALFSDKTSNAAGPPPNVLHRSSA